jgi:Domain of unknown function (DUF4062)
MDIYYSSRVSPEMTIKSVYLSSTFQDLEPFRAKVGRSLRMGNKHVIGMEDYAAADERPLDRCRADVEATDVYVGIFAYRYGFIPATDNPESKSITELEYRHARGKKPCLIFLHDEDGPWLRKFSDDVTGEGERGARIDALRKELGENHSVGFFKSEDHLAALVTAAILNLETTKPAGATPEPSKKAPDKRQITRDVLVAHAASDDSAVLALFNELSPDPGGLSSLLAPRALFARTEDDFLNLDRDVQTCDVAVAALSEITLSQMDQEPKYVSQALDILRSRTGSLLGLCLTAGAVQGAAKWNFDQVIDVSGYPGSGIGLIQSLKQALGARRTVSTVPVIGVPLVIAAMTASEAAGLYANPGKVGYELGGKVQERFEELKTALGQALLSRYGSTRGECRSPGSQLTLTALSLQAIQRLARAKNSRLQGRAIKLQRYSFEGLVSGPPELRLLYREMSDAGCILVVDELSLFHPEVRRALAQSPMVTSPHTAILTVSPFPAYAHAQAQILREELKAQLRGVFDRFESDYDPQCELNVGDECRVRRWLHQSLPETLKVLRTPRAIPEQLAIFAQELHAEDDPSVAGHLYSKGGGL